MEIDLGDGVSIVVQYKKPSQVTASQALRKGLKVLADRERQGGAGEADVA